MTAEILDYRIKQLNHITGINIFDDKSFDEALYKLIGMYSNLKKQNMEIRTKTIDEFAEKMCDKASEDSLQVMLPDGFRADVVTLDYVTEIAVEIAEQMKAGAE